MVILFVKIMINWHLGVDENISDLHEAVKLERDFSLLDDDQ